MDANLKGMWNYYFRYPRCPKCHNIIITAAGKKLVHREAKIFVEWALKKGYTRLNDVPEFETINFNE
jgi:hypothetical protein